MVNYCLHCDKKIKDEEKHIYEIHLKLPEFKNNKGNVKCRLCKIKVGNYWRHLFSKLHRHNILKKSIEFVCTTEDFISHYDKILNKTKDQVDKDLEHPFWQTAKEELNNENYKRLREYIYGRERTNNKHRNIRFRRFSRTS